MDSILGTVREILVSTDERSFDSDLIMYINSAISTLNQLGVGPEEGFYVKDESDTWTEYLGENSVILEWVKTYICQKVRLIFDPPTNSFLVDAIKTNLDELVWRINFQREYERGKDLK